MCALSVKRIISITSAGTLPMDERVKRIVAFVLPLLLWTGAVSCSDRSPVAPPLTDGAKVPEVALPSGMIVSSALASTSNGFASASSETSVAYLSAKPGTIPGALTVGIRNQTRRGSSVTAAVFDGGFDPVAIEAGVDDELSLTIQYDDNRMVPIVVKVPPRRPPVVVRTSPANGRVDVALNAQIAIVFSEPVDKASVTTASVSLTQGGTDVSGRVEVTPDGLGAAFIPDSALQPATGYSLKVDSGVRSIDGEALTEMSVVDFETAGFSSTAQLVFTRETDREIYRVGLDGTGLTRLTTEGENLRPVFSPDGSRIAFARGHFNDGDIYTMNPDGSGVVRQTVGGSFHSAEWSPDGTKLLMSDEGVYYSSLWIIDLRITGSTPRLLASDARTPAWSPDGKQIAFVRTSGDDGYHQIFIMNPDGTDQKPITVWDSGGIYGLSWSPDGERLAFSKCLQGHCALYTMRSDGSDWKAVTELPTAGGAKWSPDGKWIAFTIDKYSGSWDWLPSIAYVSADGGPVHIVGAGFWPSWRR